MLGRELCVYITNFSARLQKVKPITGTTVLLWSRIPKLKPRLSARTWRTGEKGAVQPALLPLRLR